MPTVAASEPTSSEQSETKGRVMQTVVTDANEVWEGGREGGALSHGGGGFGQNGWRSGTKGDGNRGWERGDKRELG